MRNYKVHIYNFHCETQRTLAKVIWVSVPGFALILALWVGRNGGGYRGPFWNLVVVVVVERI